jgi:DNA-binding LacI/PurR family transcriptional regulator
MSTRNHVASLARVSSATVSRAFNAPHLVSPDKLERIRKAAQNLNYSPNKEASSLRRAGSGAIMLLERARDASPADDSRFYLWLYADMVRAVKSEIEKTMFRFNLQSFSRPADVAALKGQADGIICADTPDRAELAALRKLGTPFVVFRQGEPPEDYPACSFIDEYQGGLIAGRHLRDLGHRKPAHITGSMRSIEVCQLRWKGFSDAFDRTPVLIDGQLGIKGGHDSAAHLASRIKSREIDCIFVVNDLTSIGVIQALLAAGIQIPGDVSIVGYDNLPFIHTLPLRLTTIDLQYGKAFNDAARLLLELLQSGGAIRNRVVPRLVTGESTISRGS